MYFRGQGRVACESHRHCRAVPIVQLSSALLFPIRLSPRCLTVRLGRVQLGRRFHVTSIIPYITTVHPFSRFFTINICAFLLVSWCVGQHMQHVFCIRNHIYQRAPMVVSKIIPKRRVIPEGVGGLIRHETRCRSDDHQNQKAYNSV